MSRFIAQALLLSACIVGGCERQDQNEPPNYANQPGYGGPGYGQPGYGQPPPGYGQPGQPPAPGAAPQPQPGAAPTPTQSQPAPSPAPAPAPAPTSGGTTPAPSSTGTTGGLPFPIPGMPGSSSGGSSGSTAGSATPIDPTVATAATVPLTALAAQEAPGMQREGPVIAGQFKEGQTLEQSFQIMPGKCYTVLAVGAGIQETDIQLIALTPVPGLSPTLAQDNGTGPSASLGGRGNCYKWSAPFGIQAKYVVKATRGQGIAAAQLFSK